MLKDTTTPVQLNKTKAWISAFRLRTLPLALASIGMGSFLAAAEGQFNAPVVLLCSLTTLFLQILSNLANDYGDSQNGADSQHRQGPVRAVQSGVISPRQMKTGMFVFGLLALISGLLLLAVAFGKDGIYLFILFLAIGLAAIWAAINYTAGAKPYGYAGLGDISVFTFFGLVGVLGTYFLQTQNFYPRLLLPAAALGFFSAGVLNINNIRDIHSDKLAGKNSIPVRLGAKKARLYHIILLISGFSCALLFILTASKQSVGNFLFLFTLPLFCFNGYQVWRIHNPLQIDPYLKQMALTTLLFVALFGIGIVFF